ncbi:MAG: glycosyltransferase [TACK group archaeon]|nr:glycosyltransferase [TACK group archaeon]
MEPLISVIIPSHRNTFLIDAVASVASQAFPKESYEILVVKDYAYPGLEAALERLGAKVLTTQDPSPGGKVLVALGIARGEVISFLDDDDEFLPGKLQLVASAFQNQDVDYLHNAALLIDANGKAMGQTKMHPSRKVTEKLAYLRYLSKVRADFNASSISIRRRVLDVQLLARGRYMVDTLYFASALLKGSSILLEGRPLTAFRIHGNQSDRVLTSREDFWIRRRTTFENYVRAAQAILEETRGTPYESWAKEMMAKRKLQLSLFSDLSPDPRDSLLALKPKPTLKSTLHSWALATSPYLPSWAKKAYVSSSFVRIAEARGPASLVEGLHRSSQDRSHS